MRKSHLHLIHGLYIPLSFVFFAFVGCASETVRFQGKKLDYQDMCKSGRITVWGESPIFSSISGARVKAKQDACRRAVEKCIGDEVASITGVSTGRSLLSEIYSKARGICSRDSLVSEKTYKVDTVKILRSFYRFTVSGSDIRGKIDLMQNLVGNPKIMVLIREEYSLPPKKVKGFFASDGIASSSLKKYLIGKGYQIISAARIKNLLANETYLSSTKPQNIDTRLRDTASKAGVDVLVIGRVESYPQNIPQLKGTGLKSFRADGTISIISLWGAGRVIGQYSKNVAGAHTTPYTAARAAVNVFANGRDSRVIGGMASYTAETLSDEWANLTRNNLIRMQVKGLSSTKAAGIFRDDLEVGTDIKNINVISFTRGIAVWEATYPGRSFALADTLNFYKSNPKIFRVLKRRGCSPLRVNSLRRGSIRLSFPRSCK